MEALGSWERYEALRAEAYAALDAWVDGGGSWAAYDEAKNAAYAAFIGWDGLPAARLGA